MFVLTILEKIKETRLKFFQGSVTVLTNSVTNTQLSSNICSKNKTGTILRINKKDFQDEELPH